VKIGLFGGAFDPVHVGHLNCANQSAEKFGLEKVFFIPTAVPPHKKKGRATPADRLKMVKLAISSNPMFDVSLNEMTEEKPSYSIDTVRLFRKKHKAELFYIIGLDAFEDLHKWKAVDELLGSCNFIVVSRPGSESVGGGAGALKRFRVSATGLGCKKKSGGDGGMTYTSGSAYSVHLCTLPEFGVSSTEIRHRVAVGKSINYLVPDAVGQYIIRMGLYLRAPRKRD
jgi:nicotinate-nucleotide adenylyltransferase